MFNFDKLNYPLIFEVIMLVYLIVAVAAAFAFVFLFRILNIETTSSDVIEHDDDVRVRQLSTSEGCGRANCCRQASPALAFGAGMVAVVVDDVLVIKNSESEELQPQLDVDEPQEIKPELDVPSAEVNDQSDFSSLKTEDCGSVLVPFNTDANDNDCGSDCACYNTPDTNDNDCGSDCACYDSTDSDDE